MVRPPYGAAPVAWPNSQTRPRSGEKASRSAVPGACRGSARLARTPSGLRLADARRIRMRLREGRPRETTSLSMNLERPAASMEPTPSAWSAFGYAAFTVIWTASVFSNVGTAMFDTASGWLITSLNANPLAVSLVQVAVSLPLFLFTLPAGALADVIDSRVFSSSSRSASSPCR